MSSFCKCKSYSHFSSKNISLYAIFNDQSFKDTLTNNIVSFEQLSPGRYVLVSVPTAFLSLTQCVDGWVKKFSRRHFEIVFIFFFSQENRLWHFMQIVSSGASLGGSVGCAVRLETRRLQVQPPPRSATFFRGDWSWNIFYGHSLPSPDSRRAIVSFWQKNVHNTG